MSWRAITTDDVFAGLTDPEVSAIQGKLLVSGQSDPVAEVIEQVTMECREAIRSCQDNVLHPTENYLPTSAIRHACAIIRYTLCTRFSLVLEVSEERKEEKKEAERYLDKVASCDRAVERYGAGEDDQKPTAGPAISSRGRIFTRSTEDGI